MLKLLPICAALAFEPAALPSLDLIEAKTNVSAFMQPCVPSELRIAALRRAWSVDPVVRDFKGLSENGWDFTGAAIEIAGFGELETDVNGKMLAHAVGERFGQPVATGPSRRELASIVSRMFRGAIFQPSSSK